MNAIFKSAIQLMLTCNVLASAPQCVSLTKPDRTRLADYVTRKYKVPEAIHLQVANATIVGSGCFRKLEFKARDPRSAFRLELFLSPDLRYLSRELLDSRIDPIEEERQKQKLLAAKLNKGSFPSEGPVSAPVTLTVFSDFQCPYCARFAAMLRKQIMPDSQQNVRLVFRYLPLEMHPWARPAANLAACVQSQGDPYFWNLHDYIFEHQKEFTAENVRARIRARVQSLPKFDTSRYDRCASDGSLAAKVDQDIAFASSIGITGTPTIFVNTFMTQGVAPEQLKSLIKQISGAQSANAVHREGPMVAGARLQ